MPPKGITAVVAIVLLLMMTVGAAGMAYIFTTGLQTKTQESATGGIESLTESTSSCISVDSVYGNKVYLKNCGSGVITGDSLLVYMDGKPINATMSPAVISKGEVGTLNLSGIWGLSYDTHTLKIGNGLAQVMQRVVAEPRKDDAAGIWRFDEGSGITAYDGSGNGNDGTLLPAGSEPTWVNGKFGKGLQFDGVNDYVDVPYTSSINPQNQITIEAWFNTLDAGKNRNTVVGSLYGAIYFGPLNDGSGSQAHFAVQAGGNRPDLRSPLNSITSNTWYQLVGVYDGSNTFLYLNGILQNSASLSGTIVGIGNNILIGDYPAANHKFNGTIDEVRIYSRALTPDETVNLRVA